MTWKKRVRKAAVWYLIFVVLFYVVLLVENQFGYMEKEVVSLNTPAILEEVPEIKITRADRSLLKSLSQCATVTELPEGGDITVLENEELTRIVEEYLSGEELESSSVRIDFDENGNTLGLYWERENKMPTYLEMTYRETEVHYYKTTGKKGFLSGGSIYENWDNAGAMETAVRRRWFAWIWEGLNRE